MFHYIENKKYNLSNDEYTKFNQQTQNYKCQKPVQQPFQENMQRPVQNFNLYDQSINEFFNQKDNNQIKLENQKQVYTIDNQSSDDKRDPTELYYDRLKYERNNDLEKFKEIQGGFYVN